MFYPRDSQLGEQAPLVGHVSKLFCNEEEVYPLTEYTAEAEFKHFLTGHSYAFKKQKKYKVILV